MNYDLGENVLDEKALEHDLDLVLSKRRIIAAHPDAVFEPDFIAGLGNAVYKFKTLDKNHPVRSNPKYRKVADAYDELVLHERSISGQLEENDSGIVKLVVDSKSRVVNVLIDMIELARDILSGKKVSEISPSYLHACREAIAMLPSFRNDYRIRERYDEISQRLDSAQKLILSEYGRQELSPALERKVS